MLYAGEVQSMEKRIRALKAIILVVVMIVELFGVDAVRVVAETINVTGIRRFQRKTIVTML